MMMEERIMEEDGMDEWMDVVLRENYKIVRSFDDKILVTENNDKKHIAESDKETGPNEDDDGDDDDN
uniref:Uncharacterized protein n=1 Tax=Syphacia muris TaxID=451379 RepID=A0A0N5AWG2_9BILA